MTKFMKFDKIKSMNIDDLDFIETKDIENLVAIMQNKYKNLVSKKVKLKKLREEIKRKLNWFVSEGFTDFYTVEKLTTKVFIFSFAVGEKEKIRIELFTEK